MSVLQSEFGDVLVIFFSFEILTYECHATHWFVFEMTRLFFSKQHHLNGYMLFQKSIISITIQT